MRLLTVFFIVLFLFSNAKAVFIPFGFMFAIAELSVTVYDVFILKQEDHNTESEPFINTVLSDVRESLRVNQVNIENKINSLHSTVSMQFFYENVGFRSHTTFIIAEKYLENQSNFTRDLFLNECLRNPPYALLSYLDDMISTNWFITQSQLHNCRFRDVEALRIRILYSIEQSILSHFLCMTVQTSSNESSSLTKMVLSTAVNISHTLQEQLGVIEKTYFPHYVAQEVISVVSSLPLPQTLKERNYKIANTTAFLLTESYGHGILANPFNRQFKNYDYGVYVGASDVDGLLPDESVLKIEFHDYFIFVYRSNISKIIANTHEHFFNTLITNITCKTALTPQLVNACTNYEICGLTKYDENGVTVAQNNLEQTADAICDQTRLLITGLPLGSSPRDVVLELDDSSEKKYLAKLKKTHVQVTEKLAKVRAENRKTKAAKVAEEAAKAAALITASGSFSYCVLTGISIVLSALVVL